MSLSCPILSWAGNQKLSEDQQWISTGSCGRPTRSHRLDLPLEYHFKLSLCLRRSSTRELCEVVNHMHLVVISELVCHVRPGFCWETRLTIGGRFEPGDSREQFGTHAHLLNEPTLKLADAQSCASGESVQFYPAASLNDPTSGVRDAVKALGRRD